MGLGDMLLELMTWWTQQMRDLLPSRVAGRARLGDALLVQSSGGPEIGFALRRRGRLVPLGQARLDAPEAARALLARLRRRPPVALALPAAMLLEQQAELPLAAERDLGQVLGHEMDRLTPFRADEVFWSWQVRRRDRARGRLALSLQLVPKAGLRPLLAMLEQAGLRPEAIEIAAAGGLRRVAMAPAGRGGGWRLAAAACAVLAAASLAVPVFRQERAIARLDAAIQDLQPQVARADGLRRRLAANASGADVFATEAARTGDVLAAIAAVTRSLPDNSYLTEFALRERRLSLNGRSAAAARLIGALAAEPALRDPSFAAPVTRLGTDHADQFAIRAVLAP